MKMGILAGLPSEPVGCNQGQRCLLTTGLFLVFLPRYPYRVH